MNEYVAVHFILNCSAQLVVAVLRRDADALLRAFAADQLPKTLGTHNLKCREDARGFCIRGGAVESIYLTEAAPIDAPPPLNPLGHFNSVS